MAIKYTIEDMRNVAAEQGGKCMSKEYISQYSLLSWMCKRGHTWDAPHSIVRQGGWCAQCAKGLVKEEWLQFFQSLAKKRGGKCLSKEYEDSYTKLKWECKHGHTWESRPGDVKNKNAWCPHCAGTARLTIEMMHELARQRNGKCLSNNYINNHGQHLEWECDKGH
jgi:hypothetical protein